MVTDDGRPAAMYEVRVAGHLDDHWAAVLGIMTRCSDGSTVLRCPGDQARLHGLLAGIRDLGVTLLSVRLLDGGRPGPDGGEAAAGG